jgi:hypothetical protein
MKEKEGEEEEVVAAGIMHVRRERTEHTFDLIILYVNHHTSRRRRNLPFFIRVEGSKRVRVGT